MHHHHPKWKLRSLPMKRQKPAKLRKNERGVSCCTSCRQRISCRYLRKRNDCLTLTPLPLPFLSYPIKSVAKAMSKRKLKPPSPSSLIDNLSFFPILRSQQHRNTKPRHRLCDSRYPMDTAFRTRRRRFARGCNFNRDSRILPATTTRTTTTTTTATQARLIACAAHHR